MQREKVTRFMVAHERIYEKALMEIKAGQRSTHWMWYIFPQLRGLGSSDVANYYAISNIKEAAIYLNHSVLGKHLIEISEAVHEINGKTAEEIFGSSDELKLCASMTLFSLVEGVNPVFKKVLSKYFQGQRDEKTLLLLHYK